MDKENPILKRCEALKEYSEFIEQVRSNIENNVPEPFTNAIKEAIGEKAGEERGISKGAYQKAIETARNALTMNLSVEQVAILTGLSVEEIEKL